MAYSKQWRSEFAKRLKTNQNTDSVEDAVIKLVEDKLKFFGDTSPPTNLKKLASLCGINPNFEFVEMDADGCG
jgi:hypothetical protein